MGKYSFISEHIGKPISFPDLCRLVNEEEYDKHGKPKRGKFREIKIKYWKQFMDVREEGSHLVIYDIYNDFEYIPNETHGIYATYIRYIICSCLESKNNDAYIVTYNELYRDLKIIKGSFTVAKNNPYTVLPHLKYKVNPFYNEEESGKAGDIAFIQKQIKSFFSVVGQLYHETIDNALSSMQDDQIIELKDSFRLFREVVNIDNEGNEIKYMEHHDCSDEEYLDIINFRDEVVKKMNFNCWNDLYLKHKERKAVIAKVNDYILRKYSYDIHGALLIINKGQNFKNEMAKFNIGYCHSQLYKNIVSKLKIAADMNKQVTSVLLEELLSKYV